MSIMVVMEPAKRPRRSFTDEYKAGVVDLRLGDPHACRRLRPHAEK
jgi:hypothetical protein